MKLTSIVTALVRAVPAAGEAFVRAVAAAGEALARAVAAAGGALARVTLGGALVLAAPASSAALAQSPAGPPKPDLSPMLFFVGHWTCSTTKTPEPTRMGKLTSLTVAADPRGYWLTQTTDRGVSYITWDAKKNIWAFVGIGAGGYGVSTSPGWTGNTLVVTDQYNSGDDPVATVTFTRIADSAFDITYSVTAPRPVSETNSCTKLAT